jgi:Amt family ammonium transporter
LSGPALTFARLHAPVLSGAMAQRCSFATYFTYSIVLGGFGYPLMLHWTWSENAWLADGNGETGVRRTG